ncbi:MAG: site-2 protease family protein [Ilumatobacteraceae bacterium]
MRILGFPLQIRPGFAVFLLLIVVLNGVPLGIWLAGSVAFFTVAHELGHALAARRTGATARISLDFLAGYASFTPVRRLTRRERAGIALAGPLTQILLGVIALLVIGVNPFDSADFASEAHSLAIWWAGPIIGLFNLVPVMPLDGGNVAAELIDLARPGRGRDIMIRLSVPITAGALVGMLIVPDLRPIATFAIILLVIQMQLLAAVTRPDRPETAADMVRLLADAENQAWTTGRPGLLPPGRSLSPWWSASTAISAGDRERARETIMSDLQDESGRPRTWWPPHTATPDLLEPILDVLPQPLPTPTREWPAQSVTTLVWALKRVGRHHEGARFGAEVYRTHPSTMLAIDVAACLAAEGHDDAAAQWLTVAARTADADDTSETLLLLALRNDQEFERLRERDDIRRLTTLLAATRRTD